MDPQVRSFIGSTFRSVWALELLLHLKAQGGRVTTADELVSALRASDTVVATALGALLAAGLAVEHGGKGYSYAPASASLAEMVSETELLYRSRPDLVRRIIVAASASQLSAFSDAFRLKGGDQ
jgi:biotin operon repressor